MQLSKRCEYGVRALIDLGLARALGRERVALAELAAHERISRKFLEQIVRPLAAAGWVRGTAGRGGGYRLDVDPATVPMSAVLRRLEGPLAPLRCVSETAYARCSCPDEAHCGLRLLCADLRTAMLRVLDRATLDDVVGVTLRALRRDGAPLPFRAPAARGPLRGRA